MGTVWLLASIVAFFGVRQIYREISPKYTLFKQYGPPKSFVDPILKRCDSPSIYEVHDKALSYHIYIYRHKYNVDFKLEYTPKSLRCTMKFKSPLEKDIFEFDSEADINVFQDDVLEIIETYETVLKNKIKLSLKKNPPDF